MKKHTIRDMNEIRRIAIVSYREDIQQELHKQSKAMFEGDWMAAQNTCESIIEIADQLNGELEEESKLSELTSTN